VGHQTKQVLRYFPLLLLLVITACSTTGTQQSSPVSALEQFYDSDRDSANRTYYQLLYQGRTWVPASELESDPIDLSIESEAPIQGARTKILGPSEEDANRSIAAKIWMIEQAQHTIDLTYYIFKNDMVGSAVLGALCNAVQRGVDIRIMVDAVGSLSTARNELRALESCADNAGFLRDINGNATPYLARVQVVIINALTTWESRSNRRSHDKLLIVDGTFPGQEMVMTGGRNISVDYYGIHEDGSPDPKAYRDLEILLRSGQAVDGGKVTVGDVSTIYYTLLFLHKGNKRIYPTAVSKSSHPTQGGDPYKRERARAQQNLMFLKQIPVIHRLLEKMPAYMSDGFNSSQVKLAHQLGNLTDDSVVTNAEENRSQNVNSIGGQLADAFAEADRQGQLSGTMYIVSPYLFLARLIDKQGNIVTDGAEELLTLIEKYPGFDIEIITNSVLTSDNFFTQSVIDMDTAPRLLLTPELLKLWLSDIDKSEFNPDLVESEQWKQLINNPRIKIYQTGKLDSVQLGGSTYYGKLHAKFIFWETGGFVGTSNFDNRSRFFNNEMGFFHEDTALSQELYESFELLKSMSYRWGSPEWLQMRKELMDTYTRKGNTTRSQRDRFKLMRWTGFEWLI